MCCDALKQITEAHNKDPIPDKLRKHFSFPTPSLMCSVLHPHRHSCNGVKEPFLSNGSGDHPPLAQEP